MRPPRPPLFIVYFLPNLLCCKAGLVPIRPPSPPLLILHFLPNLTLFHIHIVNSYRILLHLFNILFIFHRLEGLPRLHLGPILSGRAVCKVDQLRQAFSQQCSAKAWDPEFDSVIESVIGNCKDSFALIRGIADYRDGTRKSPWQAYSSLAAAAVVKAIVCAMDPPNA